MFIKQIAVILALLFFSLDTTLAAPAQNNVHYEHEPYIVKNVTVFADSGNLIDSKKIALMNATNDALLLVLKRLTSSKVANKLNDILKEDQSYLVSKYDILKNRSTSHSYSAIVNIVFDSEGVKAFLVKNGITFSDKLYNKCLVIPFSTNSQKTWILETWKQPELSQLGMVAPVIVQEYLEHKDPDIFQSIMDKPYSFFNELLLKYNAQDLLLVGITQEEGDISAKLKLLTPNQSYYKNAVYEDIEYLTPEQGTIFQILTDLDMWWKGDKNVFKTKISQAD